MRNSETLDKSTTDLKFQNPEPSLSAVTVSVEKYTVKALSKVLW